MANCAWYDIFKKIPWKKIVGLHFQQHGCEPVPIIRVMASWCMIMLKPICVNIESNQFLILIFICSISNRNENFAVDQDNYPCWKFKSSIVSLEYSVIISIVKKKWNLIILNRKGADLIPIHSHLRLPCLLNNFWIIQAWSIIYFMSRQAICVQLKYLRIHRNTLEEPGARQQKTEKIKKKLFISKVLLLSCWSLLRNIVSVLTNELEQ